MMVTKPSTLIVPEISDVNNKKLNWIKEFRQVTGASLQSSKFMFDLLWSRGYDLNSNHSLLVAAKLYNRWIKIATGITDQPDFLVGSMLRDVVCSNAGNLALFIEMAGIFGKLPLEYRDNFDVPKASPKAE